MNKKLIKSITKKFKAAKINESTGLPEYFELLTPEEEQYIFNNVDYFFNGMGPNILECLKIMYKTDKKVARKLFMEYLLLDVYCGNLANSAQKIV
jgi:hypothetical protein